jgi:rhomboid protease GluP
MAGDLRPETGLKMPIPKRQSILCPNCRKLISKDETRCPHCGTRSPGRWWKNNFWTSGMQGGDQLVKMIVYVNIGMYALSILFNPRSTVMSFNPLTTFAPAQKSLLLLGATGTLPIDQLHRWWTILSANYLHGGILHILFNMVAFWQLAPLIIQEYGTYRMFVIYTVSGLFGYWVSYLAEIAFTIGASAAVCGLIGAALFYGKSRGGSYGQALYKQVGGWAVGIFIFGLLVPGINNWGHGGGILAGILLGLLIGYQEQRKENIYHKLLAGGCAVLTVMVLIWAVTSGLYYRLGA